jgi:hypothetical protein
MTYFRRHWKPGTNARQALRSHEQPSQSLQDAAKAAEEQVAVLAGKLRRGEAMVYDEPTNVGNAVAK